MYKKGQILVINNEAYDRTYILGVFIVLKDFDFVKTSVYLYHQKGIKFKLFERNLLTCTELKSIVEILVETGYLKTVESQEIHLLDLEGELVRELIDKDVP